VTAALRGQFERCRAWIEAALAVDAEATADHLLGEVLAGRVQLWPGERCCVVTQCVLTPQGPTIHVWCGGGRLSEMAAMRPGIEAWGRSMGCIWITGESRKAWDRLLKPFGYVRDGDVLRKAL
jgi:hypothetical protein